MKQLLLAARCCFFCVGMSTAALGIAIVTNASLGTTPITSIPLVCDGILPLSVGGYTAIINTFFVIAQKFILGPKFRTISFLQLLPMLVFSAAIDFWLFCTDGILALPYTGRFAFLLVGIATLALGIFIQVVSNVTVMPGEGLVLAIAYRTHHSFGSIKVITDCCMVGTAALLGFAFLGTVIGIREGTVLSAVLTGFVVRFYSFCARKMHLVKQ